MMIFAQAVGFAALGVCVASFQCKTYSRLLLLQVGSTLLFLAHFSLLALSGTPAAWTAAASNAICLVRNLVFYRTREKGSSTGRAVFFALLLVGFGLLTWGGFASAFCIVSMVLNTVAMSARRPQAVRGLTLAGIPFLLVYDVLTGSLAGMLNESIAAGSALIGLWRYRSHPTEKES